jgi:hypothetical protein
LRPPLPKGALDQEAEALSTRNCLDCTVPDNLCKTLQSTCNETKIPGGSRTNRQETSPDLIRMSSRAMSPTLGRCRLPSGLERQRRCTSPDPGCNVSFYGMAGRARRGQHESIIVGGYPVMASKQSFR